MKTPLDIITSGYMLEVEFVKKNGEARTMECAYGLEINEHGNLVAKQDKGEAPTNPAKGVVVYDFVKDDYRSIIPNSVKEIRYADGSVAFKVENFSKNT